MSDIVYGTDPSEGKHEFVHGYVLNADDLNDIDNGIYDSVTELNRRISIYQTFGEDFSDISEVLTDGIDAFETLEEETLRPVKNHAVEVVTRLLHGIDARFRYETEYDCNDFIETGNYVIDAHTLHSPLEGHPNGIAYVLTLSNGTTANQICIEGANNELSVTDPRTGKTISVDPGKIHVRAYDGSSWNNWTTLLYDWSSSYPVRVLKEQLNQLGSRITVLEREAAANGNIEDDV